MTLGQSCGAAHTSIQGSTASHTSHRAAIIGACPISHTTRHAWMHGRAAPVPATAETAHRFMGASMRRSSWRAHWMLPATGGAFLGRGGAALCFSYCPCTASRSRA